MLVCGALVLIGIAMIVMWGNEEVQDPPGSGEGAEVKPTGAVLKLYLWRVALVFGCGAGAGILMAGAGGRLAMRLLAVTGPESAQGRVTEADQVVGQITFGGTMGFIVFVGIFFGLVIGIFYMAIRRWLPSGRLGGVAFGFLLLVWFGTIADPLRPDNPDFEIVGPGWVSILTFATLVLLHGMLVAAVAGRYSRSLPLISKDWRTVIPYAPLLLLVPGIALLLVVLLGAVVALTVNALPKAREIWASRRVSVAGRVLTVGATAVMLPIFVMSMVEILEKSPN